MSDQSTHETADAALAAVARAGQRVDYAFELPRTKTWAVRLAPAWQTGHGATLAEALAAALEPLPALGIPTPADTPNETDAAPWD